MSAKQMTVAEALRDAARNLAQASDTARLDAELLMAYALGVSRSDLLLRHMRDDVPGPFAALVDRRARHEPVAYICGVQEFYGLDFAVAPGVLIPRADSETTLVAALDATAQAGRMLDCGTGPGTLLLAYLAQRPAFTGMGIDCSSRALELAAGNAASLGLADRAEFRLADWNKPDWADDLGLFDLIIANPPYVEQSARLSPDVRDFEPAGALFAGPEGLDDYRVLIPQLPGLLAANGVAVLEIGAMQAGKVTEIAAAAGLESMLHRDLAGRARALVMR